MVMGDELILLLLVTGSDSRSSSDSESEADDAPKSPVAGLRPPTQPPRS